MLFTRFNSHSKQTVFINKTNLRNFLYLDIPMTKKILNENPMTELISNNKEIPAIPAQGLLLCPKEDPMKKKKKKKIAASVISNT